MTNDMNPAGVEAAAKAMCRAHGYDINEPMANNGPRWRYYVPSAEAAIPAYLASLPSPDPARVDSREHLSVNIANDVLTISIGMGTLANAIRFNPKLAAWDVSTGDELLPEITDAMLFGKELIRTLKSEEEDGTTPVHLMLDAATLAAVENGAEGIVTGYDKLDDLRRTRALVGPVCGGDGCHCIHHPDDPAIARLNLGDTSHE